MNKFAASLGLVALGTTAVQAVEATALNTMQRTKPWSVAATLNGFYDDNINTTETGEVDSFGFEIRPSVDFGLAGDQTSFNLGYQLSAKWYETAPFGSDNWDLSHIFEGYLAHTFNPNLSVRLSDSFIIGQEPDALRDPATNQRIEGNNIVNFGSIFADYDATQLLAFTVGYRNNYFNYDQEGPGSNSALLDRIENYFTLDSKWKLRPNTSGIVGYTYGQTLYTGDEALSPVPGSLMSDSRDVRVHRMYVGAQHSFTPTLLGMLKVGAEFLDYYGDPNGDTQWSPYVEGTMSYQYQSATAMNMGFTYKHSAADVAGLGSPTDFVRDTETATFYGSVSHEIIAHLIGTAKGTVQYSTYNGGGSSIDGESYLYFQLGLDLAYQFSPNLSAHIGYNYDDTDSDLAGQSYNRNRVYLGVSAGY